jgi:hypothetical protein
MGQERAPVTFCKEDNDNRKRGILLLKDVGKEDGLEEM